MSPKKVKLVECLNTFQGEGPDSGKRCLLIRFKKCNREPSCTWCDTYQKINNLMESSVDFEDIQRRIIDRRCGLLITGGEPTHEDSIGQVIDILNLLDYPYANVETNGYGLINLIHRINPNKIPRIKFIYSPKLFTESDLTRTLNTITNISLEDYVTQVYYKIVVEDNLEEEVVLQKISKLDLNHMTYLMPLGANRDEVLSNTARTIKSAELYNVNFTSRNHLINGFV